LAISTYADLKTAVQNWLNRSNLTDRIPEFIALAETRIHYGSKEKPFESEPLRIRAMETSQYTTISAQRVELPTGFLQARRFFLSGTPVRKLDMVSTDQFWDTWVSSQGGTPKEFCTEGEEFVFGPTPDAEYTAQLLYYKKFDSLSAGTDTNWLLTNASGAYLYGALIEAHSFTRNDAQAQLCFNKYMGIIDGLNLADKRDRQSGSAWVIKNDSGNP